MAAMDQDVRFCMILVLWDRAIHAYRAATDRLVEGVMKPLSWVLTAVALLAWAACHADTIKKEKVRVAFVISDGFDLIDFAGPWEVFQDVMLGSGKDDMDMPYELYTVSSSKGAVTSSGGARVTPQYTLDSAPRPDVIVIGAQSDSSEPLLAWLRSQHASQVTIMSVCVGARKLALAGLLDGKPATTHHEYLDGLQKAFPRVQWLASRRYVRSEERVYTAGGLTSGIDLALHLVAVRFGQDVAQKTADYMEYHGDGWKQAD
jgi:transcriptional regulator GlxA family with amidase domain